MFRKEKLLPIHLGLVLQCGRLAAENVRRAVITGNIFSGKMKVNNAAKGNVQMGENADAEPMQP